MRAKVQAALKHVTAGERTAFFFYNDFDCDKRLNNPKEGTQTVLTCTVVVSSTRLSRRVSCCIGHLSLHTALRVLDT